MAVTPKSSSPWVRILPHSVFDQPDAQSVVAQYDRVLDTLTDELPEVAEHLDATRADSLASTAFPRPICAKSGPTIPGTGSAQRSAAAPTWAPPSFPSARPSSAWSARCCQRPILT
jgi:putative transposase